MQSFLNEFISGLKKPFQSEAEQALNKSSATGAYALAVGIFLALR